MACAFMETSFVLDLSSVSRSMPSFGVYLNSEFLIDLGIAICVTSACQSGSTPKRCGASWVWGQPAWGVLSKLARGPWEDLAD